MVINAVTLPVLRSSFPDDNDDRYMINMHIQCDIMANSLDTNGWMFVLQWKNHPHCVTSSVACCSSMDIPGKLQGTNAMICQPCRISAKIKFISHSTKSSFYLKITCCHFSPPMCCTTVSLPSDKQQLSHAIRNLHMTSTVLGKRIMLYCSLTNLQSSLWVNKPLYQKCYECYLIVFTFLGNSPSSLVMLQDNLVCNNAIPHTKSCLLLDSTGFPGHFFRTDRKTDRQWELHTAVKNVIKYH
jgi:hypothetical protein